MIRLAVKTVSVCICTWMAISGLGSGGVHADVIPDRRREQFQTEPAHLIAPFPYSLPGIGSGLFLLGWFSNIAESPTDLIAVLITGDAEGGVVFLDELPVYSRRLLFQFLYQDITKAAVNSYEKRGMDTDKNDFNIVEFSSARATSVQLFLNFFDRRLEFFAGNQMQSQTIEAIRNSKGKILFELDEPLEGESEGNWLGLRLDLTDDREDPRVGLRLWAEKFENERNDKDDPDYFTIDHSTLVYIPVGEISTWVFNYYRSDAIVRQKGNTGRQALIDDLGANCDASDTECLDAESDFVNNTITVRKYGSATSLGGQERLRAYPGGRFQGAHMAFYGTEFRWNLTEEFTPFDYFIWKDVRTGVQLAFFYETGTVAEKSSQLWDESRESYGTAIRLVTGSGTVYKAEFATGDEGNQLIVFFFYPWE